MHVLMVARLASLTMLACRNMLSDPDFFSFIEIETSTKCNRLCPWCPVSKFKDRTEQKLMDWELFQKIILELKNIGYRYTIALHNYNEPLLNVRLRKEIEYIKKSIPDVHCVVFSNGDFLTRRKIEMLADIKLNTLRITRYPLSGFSSVPHSISEWITSLNLDGYTWEKLNMQNSKGYYWQSRINDTEIKIISPNIHSYNTRAGLFSGGVDRIRKQPCAMTSTSIAISNDGSFKMCCNIYPAYSKHIQYIMGNLNKNSLMEIWMSNKFSQLRSDHLKAQWSNSPVCLECTMFGDSLG